MKKAVLIIFTFFCVNDLFSQNLEAFISVDTRGGYSTNTYLHPFIGEWDQNDRGAFTRLSPSAELYWNSGRFSTQISGGYLYEPTFDNRQDWTGMYGSTRLNYRVGNRFSMELQASANQISSVYDRTSFSVLPALTWSPSLFTNIRLRGGSSFREYRGLMVDETEESGQARERFDIYGFEFERWTSLKWQLRGSVYALMDENPLENHSLSAAVSRIIRRSSGVTFDLSLNRYQNSFTVDGQGGLMPVSGTVTDGSEIIEDSDQLLRSRLSFSFPIAGGLTGNGSISHLLFMPAAIENRSDMEISVGFRYRFSVTDAVRYDKNKLSPEWESRSNHAVIVKIGYRGEGDLFLVGEFNDWDRPGVQLSRQGENSSRYAAQLELEPGIYEYKVLLRKDGEESWVELSDDTMTVSDGFGGINGLIFID